MFSNITFKIVFSNITFKITFSNVTFKIVFSNMTFEIVFSNITFQIVYSNITCKIVFSNIPFEGGVVILWLNRYNVLYIINLVNILVYQSVNKLDKLINCSKCALAYAITGVCNTC